MKRSFLIEGVYLVIDPAMEQNLLLRKLKAALQGGVGLVQIWNNWAENISFEAKIDLTKQLSAVTHDYNVPLLINNDWQLLKETKLDGVHFDAIPTDFKRIKAEIGKTSLFGLTCSNDLDKVAWATQQQFDYISFCAVFPSPSAGSCEIVRPETILKARALTDLPLFVSGGINLENIDDLKEYNIQGVAVISGILNADSPEQTTRNYLKQLKNLSQ